MVRMCITAFVFSDLVDGAMARKMGRKDDFGAFLDSTLDRVADGALFGGLALFFAWHHESRLYLVLCLVILVMGAVTSYARAKADHLGYDAKVGIAERPDRLVGMLGSGTMDAMAIATGQWDVLFQHSVTDWDRLPGAAIIRGAGGDSVVVAASGVDWTVSGAPAAVADVRAALLDG